MAGLLALLVWGALLLWPPPAQAHANLARSTPAADAVLPQPPARIVLWFTEPIEPGLSEIQVLDAAGGRVDDGNSIVDPRDATAMSVGIDGLLPDGGYVVGWKNVSTIDGHLVRGSFRFSVGAAAAGPAPELPAQPLLQSPAEPPIRWLTLLGGLAAVGGLLFELLMLRPALASAGGVRREAGGGPAAERAGLSAGLSGRLLRRSRRLVWLAAAVFAAASVAHLLLQSVITHETSLWGAVAGPVWSVLADTEWGRLWLWRAALTAAFIAALAGLPLLARRMEWPDDGGRAQALRLLPLAIGAGMLWTLSLTSHGAATAGIRNLALLADYLHLLAAAFWVGALVSLAAGIPLLRRAAPGGGTALLAAILPRFSVVAALSVAALLVTGVFSAWAQVTTPSALNTPYGLTLLAKMALSLPLLLLGALNLLWVRPRLARGGADGPAAGHWLGRFVAGEVVLAVLVLASVGVLTTLEPARQTASRQGIGVEDARQFQDTVQGDTLALELAPGQTGANDLTVTLIDRLGRPIADAAEVTVRLSYLEADLGEAPVTAVSQGNGRYTIAGAPLSIAGAWQAELVVRRPDAFDARTAFRFETGPAGAGGSSAITPAPETANLLLGAGLALLGMLCLGMALPLGGWLTRNGALVTLPGLAGFAVGLTLLLNTQLGQTDDALRRNPFPPTAESLQAGQTLYAANCQTCHGAGGRGDGPSAAGLTPPPADLTIHAPLHPEGELYEFIQYGVPGTAMAPLGSVLTEEEIWHIVNYINTLE